MTFNAHQKISPLLASLLCHLMVVNGFAAVSPGYSKNLSLNYRILAVDLDLVAPQLAKPKTKEIAERMERIIPVPKIQTVDTDQETLLQKRAELDERIKLIRAKLKRTVKKQQLKREVDAQKGFQILSLEKGGPEWEAYLQQIRAKVLNRWYPKLIASENRLVKSEAQLNFEIFLDGRIKNYEVVQWKGSEGFKRISLEAFQDAMPFEPFQSRVSTSKKSKSYPLTLFFYYQ